MGYKNAILKQYPDHVTIYIPKGNIFNNNRKEVTKHEYNSNDNKVNHQQDFLQKSIDRTHSTVRDYILCNNFTWFFTLTISPDKCDRHDDKSVQKLLKLYIDKIRRHNSLEYIMVPERHKNGALHFHGLLNNPPELIPTNKRDSSGRPRYENPDALKMLGFNDWTKIENKDALSHYVRKYITKSMIIEPNKRRYYCSKNLKKPEKHYFDLKDLPDAIWESMTDLDYAYYGEFGV